LAMQLIQAPASPFARKARVVIHETGLSGRVEEVPVATTPLAQDPTLVRANPLGKIPALIRDDGPTIYDSRVITRYLDAIASSGLYPPGRIWEILTLEAMADGIMEAALAITYEKRFREELMRSEDLMRGQRDRVSRALDVLCDRWMSHLGGHLNIGQIGIACALGYLDLRHGDMRWRDGRNILADWYARFAERESMKATEPEG
jgi:glutathione S-transferase